MSRTFRALGVRNYRRYAAGQLVANTGIWMQRVAQDWLVLELTGGSATALGLTIGLQFLPTLLLSLLGGTLADRFPRRPLLIATSSTMALLGIVLGGIVLSGSATVTIVMAVALLLGGVSAMDTPARQAFVSEMVDLEDLPNAVALGTASFNLGRVVGPSLAGLLIAWVGTGWVFLVTAAAFGGVLVALLGVRTDELREPVRRSTDDGGLREGLRYVIARPELLTVLAVAFFVGTFGLNFNLYLATMTSQVFDGGAESFGMASTVLALGSLAGSLAAARRGAPRLRLVVLAGIAFGLASVLVAVMPTYPTFLLALPLVGMSALTLINAMQSFLQVNAAPEVRGRVIGIYMLLFIGGTPLGSPLVGRIADTLGPRWAIVVGGTVSLVAAVVAGLLRLRRGGMAVRAHLTPRPHLHVRPVEERTELLPLRVAVPGRRLALLPVAALVVAAGGWWLMEPARASDDLRLPARVAFTVQDPDLTELSGMAAGRSLPGVTWLVEDSGNPPDLVGVDALGRTVAVVTISGAVNDDWEALAPGEDADGRPVLWVGDIGDNDRERDAVTLYRVPEPTTTGEQRAEATAYRLAYPDGPHDAEALVADGPDVYVVTKQATGAGVYRATDPSPESTTTLEPVARAPAFVTDAALHPVAGELALRTYTSVYLLPSPAGGEAQHALLPPQPQGETLAWTSDGRSLLSGSEGLRSTVYRVSLPAAWRSPTASPTTSATNPADPTDDDEGVPSGVVLLLTTVALVVGVAVALGVSRAAARRSRSTR